MIRTLLACTVIGLVASTAGCRMCAHPFDECGPMFGGQCDEECYAHVRAGSILSGTTQAMPYDEITDGVIISTTDEVVEPPTLAAGS